LNADEGMLHGVGLEDGVARWPLGAPETRLPA
jgi:hypothetical protein